ncbi:hypothetical protein C8J57DRAFT_1262844 [Mycena rebaudengoi]|nr:hypothetical protein C8J57DRAFT_1262844 [Mycena rebaudengoi]
MSPSKTRRAKAQQKKLERAQAVLASESWRKPVSPQRSLDPPDPDGHRRRSDDDREPPPMSTHRSVDLHDPIGGLSPLTSLLESTRRSDIRAPTAQDLAAIQLPESRPASEPTNDRKRLEHAGQKTMSVGSAQSDERRRVTVETVTDEEDIYRMRSNIRSRSAGVRAPTGAKTSRSGSRMSSRKSESHGRQGQDKNEDLFDSISPYPTLDVIQDYESDDMSDTTRAQRKASKRRHTPTSVSSDKSRDKSGRSGKSVVASHDDGCKGGDEVDPLEGWNETTKRLAALAVEQDRLSRSRTEDGQRSRETLQRNLCRLLELRCGEDRALAEELLLRDLQELEDRRLAEQLEVQSDNLDQSRRMATEQQRKIAAAELQLQLDREKAERYDAVVREQERKASHSVTSKHDKAPRLIGTPKDDDQHASGSRVKLDFADRIILQRYRIADMLKTGGSNVPDQGIQWGADGKPYETRPAWSRDASVTGEKITVQTTAPKVTAATGQRSMGKPKSEETLEQSLANQAKREWRESMKPSGFYERAGTAPKKVPKVRA